MKPPAAVSFDLARVQAAAQDMDQRLGQRRDWSRMYEPTKVERLREVVVELPRIAAPNPADPAEVDSRLEQPYAGVDCRLPRPDHREAVGRLGQVDKVVWRDERDARLDRESGNVTRWNLGNDRQGPPPLGALVAHTL
jgi:hypothetical protein